MRGKVTKVRANLPLVHVYVLAAANNTQVVGVRISSIPPYRSRVLAKATAGRLYKGAKRKGPTAAQDVGRLVGKRLRSRGMASMIVRFSGRVDVRGAAAKGLKASGLQVTALENRTPKAHGGSTPKKARRV